MISLTALFVLGLALGMLPWRLVAIGIALAASGALAAYLFGGFGNPGSLIPFGVTALLLGWACALLIRRTIAERAL